MVKGPFDVSPDLRKVPGSGQDGVITPASREASHDHSGATGQADDVVSDGADQMAGQTSCLQPFKSGQVGTPQKQNIHHSLSAAPLGVPGEVFQMLRIGMHDVAMG